MCETNAYIIQGMTCSSCSTKVSTAVNLVPGVMATDVDLATATLTVTGPAVEAAAVRLAITAAGYRIA